MFGFLFLFVLLIPFWVSADEYEWVKPESYSIRRFQEIVDLKFQDDAAKDPSEKILEKRARLEMSKRDQKNLETNPRGNAASSISQESLKKAASAQVQHYQILIDRLENSVVKRNQKSQTKNRSKSK